MAAQMTATRASSAPQRTNGAFAGESVPAAARASGGPGLGKNDRHAIQRYLDGMAHETAAGDWGLIHAGYIGLLPDKASPKWARILHAGRQAVAP